MKTACQPIVISVFAGAARLLRDEAGVYRSSIAREPVHGPVAVTYLGIPGDESVHALPDRENKALCVHLMSHYRYWQQQGIHLPAGYLGENLVVDGLEEWEVCVGDVVELGTLTVQVSRPRVPCRIQARRVGRPDWVQRTVQARRTGFYLRVLQPGCLQPGVPWRLVERPHPRLSIDVLNRLAYFQLDASLAREAIQAEALTPDWRRKLELRLHRLRQKTGSDV